MGCQVQGGGAVPQSPSCSFPHKALPSGLEFCYSVGVILAPCGYEERVLRAGEEESPQASSSSEPPLLPQLPAGPSLALGSHMAQRQTWLLPSCSSFSLAYAGWRWQLGAEMKGSLPR